MNLKFLCVDDESDIIEILADILENVFNCSVDSARTGREAMEKVVANHYDLILSDYKMPEGDGGDLYRYLVEKKYNLPFVLVTGSELKTLGDFENFIYDHPGNLHLKKPFHFKDVVNVVAESIIRGEVLKDRKNIRLYKRKKISSGIFVMGRIAGTRDEEPGELVNISRGGFCLSDYSRGEVGDILQIHIPSQKFGLLSANVKIIWKNTDKSAGLNNVKGIGVSIIDPSTELQEFIDFLY